MNRRWWLVPTPRQATTSGASMPTLYHWLPVGSFTSLCGITGAGKFYACEETRQERCMVCLAKLMRDARHEAS